MTTQFKLISLILLAYITFITASCNIKKIAAQKQERANNALINAVRQGYTSDVQILLDNGANPNSTDRIGKTSLMLAKDIEIAKLLIKKGADVNARYGGKTPLIFAIEEAHIGIVQTLLSNGADVNTSGHMGMTPLMCAIWAGNIKIAQLLIDNGADIHAKDHSGNGALFYITPASNNYEAIKAMLLRHGYKE